MLEICRGRRLLLCCTQLAATRDLSSPASGEYVRAKIVEPSIAHAIDVQTKMNTRAAIRLTMIFSVKVFDGV